MWGCEQGQDPQHPLGLSCQNVVFPLDLVFVFLGFFLYGCRVDFRCSFRYPTVAGKGVAPRASFSPFLPGISALHSCQLLLKFIGAKMDE